MPEKLQLNGYYGAIMVMFATYLRKQNQLSEAVLNGAVSHVRRFCQFLQDKERNNLGAVRVGDINEYIVHFGKTHNEMYPMLAALKKFNACIKQNNISCVDFEHVLIARPAPRRKVLPAFTKSDIDAIRKAIRDRNHPSVKRDFAIVELAISTGLRAVDISELKLTDIDWHKSEISLVQRKTDNGLCLPLETQAGNAIADYVLRERPKNADSQYVFLTTTEPFKQMEKGAIANQMKRYFEHAGVYVPGSKMGFHSFRRYVATQMIDNGVELDAVREVLGDKQINSLKPYIRGSKRKLAACALGFDNIPVLQEEFA